MRFMQRNSLRYKLILFLLVSIIVPISISILITYHYTKESVKQYYIRETTNLIHQGALNIANYMGQLNEASLLVYNDLSEPNSLYQLIQDGSQTYIEEREMYRNLQFMANSVPEVEQIYIYSAVEDTSFRYAYKLFRYAPGQTFAFDRSLIPEGHDVFVEAVHRSHEYGVGKPKFPYHIEQDVISIHRLINKAPSGERLGLLSLDVRPDVIQEISKVLFTPDLEELYIFNADGAAVFASEPEGASGGWIHDLLARPSTQGHYHYEDDLFQGIHLYENIPVDWLDWTIVKRIPYESLYQDALQLTFINTLVVSLFLIIAVIATLYISFRFTNPIKKLLRYIHKIESGKLDADIDIDRTDEIGILARRFHQLVQRLNHLIVREYRLQLANKTNQLKALQAQVNPHFMNNTLQSIGTLALQHGDRKVYALISSLGKMMRYHMKSDDTGVPLAEEIDYVKSYLALQRQRFDNRLHYQIDVDEEAASVLVPRMILQPIVENYFKHSFSSDQENGEILIVCRQSKGSEHDNLEIIVEDNGSGIEAERREQLQSMLDRPVDLLEPSSHEHDHIGLMNVVSRLRLFFDQSVHMRLEAGQAGGLRVRITIPQMRK